MKKRILRNIGGSAVFAISLVGLGFGVYASTTSSDTNTETLSAGVAETLNSYFWESEDTESDLLTLVTPTVSSSEEDASTTEETETEETSIYDTIAISQVTDYVNVRAEASTDSEIVGKIYDECAATIISEENGWYYIQSGNVTGYVNAEYFVTGDEAETLAAEIGFVKATCINGTGCLLIRSEASTDSDVLSAMYDGETYDVVEEGDEWVEIDLGDGVYGWVYKEYVDIAVDYDTAVTLEEEAEAEEEAEEEEATRIANTTSEVSDTTSSSYSTYYSITSASDYDSSSLSAIRASIVSYAEQFVGWLPYVSGGNSLSSGTDCSGFTKLIYAQFGYTLSRTSSAQASDGISVPISEILPGDIVIYSGHVAIYVGGGMIIDMPGSGNVCTERSMYIMSIKDIRRIVY